MFVDMFMVYLYRISPDQLQFFISYRWQTEIGFKFKFRVAAVLFRQKLHT